MLRVLMVACAVLVCSSPVGVFAMPWGADDGGYLPPDMPGGPITKCENRVAKSVAKLAKDLMKCRAGRAAGRYVDEAAEEVCELAARAKFDRTKTIGCAPCTSLATTGDDVENHLGFFNLALGYCAPGVPFGTDETGNIPNDAPNGPVTQCENRTGGAVAKLIGDIFKCHSKRAMGKYPDDASEDVCEMAARDKLRAVNVSGCDPCTDPAAIGIGVGGFTNNAFNADVYCAEGQTCGNGVREGSEACDGTDPAGCPGDCTAACTCRPPCEATTGGYCWFRSAPGDYGYLGCTDTCASVGRTYDPATDTFAGTHGSDANCLAVMNALGFPGTVVQPTPRDTGLGCVFYPPYGIFRDAYSTVPDATNNDLSERACACQ